MGTGLGLGFAGESEGFVGEDGVLRGGARAGIAASESESESVTSMMTVEALRGEPVSLAFLLMEALGLILYSSTLRRALGR